jgi:hypothetical protein
MKPMIKPVLRPTASPSPQFPFIYGRYALSTWRVPYFVTSMTVTDAAKSLKLVNEFPGAESLNWKIDELYQRDLDWTRVQRQILPYLKANEQPQFFNALTIALLPIRNRRIDEGFDSNGWNAPDLDAPEQFSKVLRVGPVSCGYYSEWERPDDLGGLLGQVRWNTDEVFSVAIDGQHRLGAIKELEQALAGEARLAATRVPVILVLLAKQLGYESPHTHDQISVSRRLFIDLNKHAKSVSRSRQILLDDNDPTSLCVRAMVGRELGEGKGDLFQNPPRLPLTLVDWHSEQAKFEDTPYLTTILGLDWIVSAAVGSPSITDYSAYSTLNRCLIALSDSLGVNFKDAGSPTRKRLAESEEAARPFYFTGGLDHERGHEGELGEIVSKFESVWLRPLTTLLTELTPYARVIGVREANGTLSPEFVNWYYLYSRAAGGTARAQQDYHIVRDRLLNRRDNPLSENSLKDRLQQIRTVKGEDLAFKVVYQRALVLAFLEFCKIDQLQYNELAESASDDEAGYDEILDDDLVVSDVREHAVDMLNHRATPTSVISERVSERATQFVAALNDLLSKAGDFHDLHCGIRYAGREHRLWLGALLSPDGTIEFTKAASVRAKEVVLWVAILKLCASRRDPLISAGFDHFWTGIDSSDISVHKRLLRSINRYSAESAAAGRIITGREDAYTLERGLEECEIRLKWIWDQLGLSRRA